MAMRKKIVMLPYDFDTSIGIDNYGRLKFSYELEDIDTVDGEKVYAGQDSVLWKNVRAAFEAELTAMYRSLRTGNDPVLSYDNIKEMFEEHQEKWPEALFNEDSWYKYILPLIEKNENRLEMCLGSKAEQRKWWLYNRFKYIDSKYNAGEASADSVSFRAYYEPAQGETYGVTITPYADIYATVVYGVAKGQLRAPRNQAILVPCSLSHLEFTDTYIYSASQIKSFGDLSIFRPDAVEFSNASHIQELKLGDSSSSYENPNLKALSLGNNVLLKKIDCRNCVNMGTGTQKTVDLSGCSSIEEVYFDGTAIQGMTLPNGGLLKKLHLPATITNLTLLNQKNITEFVCPDYSNVTTLRIENVSDSVVNVKSIISDVSAGCRVRLIGFYWTASNATEISGILDLLDTMRGLDEQGGTINIEDGGCHTTVSGEIHTDSLTGSEIAEFNARYPYLKVTADSVTSVLYYKTWDGSSTVKAVTYINGVPQDTAPSVPSRTATAQYNFTAVGWNLEQDASVDDPDCTKDITGDRTVYAAYSRVVRTYTATFMRASEDGGGTLYTQQNIPYGTVPTYGGSTPTTTRGDAQEFTWIGWTPELVGITGNTTYYAVFKDNTSVTRQLIKKTIKFAENSVITSIGNGAFYSCLNLTTISFPAVTSIGAYAFQNCSSLTTASFPNVTTIGVGAFQICKSLTTADFPNATSIGNSAFYACSRLTTASFPNVTSIGPYAFQNCHSLIIANYPAAISLGINAFQYCTGMLEANFPNVTTIGGNAFDGCTSLTTASFPNATSIGGNAFTRCSNLTTISFPVATFMGANAFQSCSSLTTASFPAVTSIGTNAFSNCSKLATASFPNVMTISSNAFVNCLRFISLYLTGSSIPKLSHSNAFTATPIGGYTDYTGGQLGSIFVPSSLYQSYLTANNWSYFSSRFVSI